MPSVCAIAFWSIRLSIRSWRTLGPMNSLVPRAMAFCVMGKVIMGNSAGFANGKMTGYISGDIQFANSANGGIRV